MDEQKIPAGHGQAEIEIKKSRFIANVWPVQTEEEALGFLEQIRSEHKKAAHHVYAYLLGDDDSVQRFSDDGEPGGTAGRPIMEVIRGEEMHQILIVVTRYFGGTLLGSGGLVRAYSQAAREGLQAAGTLVYKLMARCQLTIPYDLSGKADYYFSRNHLVLENTCYSESVKYTVYIPIDQVDLVTAEWADISGGQAQWNREEEMYRPVKV